MKIWIFLVCPALSLFLLVMTIMLRKLKQMASQMKLSYCAICMEDKPIEEMFENRKCSHSFCEDCVGSYIAAKIQENVAMVKCLDTKCNGIWEPYDFISIIPKDVFERWENAVVENLVLASKKFYCPFNDCSAMLVNDGNQVVTVSECPYCHRLFCAQCKAPWHEQVDCREFQSSKNSKKGWKLDLMAKKLAKKGSKLDGSELDLMAVKLAKKKKWKKCSNCRVYVERRTGCNHMTCRCGHQFCYICGSIWEWSHSNCVIRQKPRGTGEIFMYNVKKLFAR